MPVQKVMKNGKTGYRWGKTGKVYTGKDAKQRATKQGKAIKANSLSNKTRKRGK